jgi:hypothetical protein
MFEATQARFGTRVALYQGARGDRRLTTATPDGLEAMLANRIWQVSGESGRELKSWMALLSYLSWPAEQGGPCVGGWIPAEYASSDDFRQFPGFGAAVRGRNESYPLEQVEALAALCASLHQAP